MKRKSIVWLIALTVFVAPTFVKMFRGGIFSMQDFPYFRLVEYSKCLSDLQIPCRWAPDAGLGFGEPVFNFYSQLPFFLGAVFVQSGVSAIFSLKLLFILSFIGSAFAMFFLAKEVWKSNLAAFLSAGLYVYAPYRAVDVWVRGALPESFAFIFLPLVLLFFEKYIHSKKNKWLGFFSLSIAAIVLTHNLSVILFAHAIGAWIIVRLFQTNSWRLLPKLLLASVLSILISGFYLLPSVFESQYVNLQSTTEGYFNFRAHFVTLGQLFLSRFWGYGGSTWGSQDGLSLSVGQVQWIVAGLALFSSLCVFFLNRKKFGKSEILTIHLVLCGLFYLFLTHNQSAFLWEAFSTIMKYIQFPWRFLGVAVFSFSLAAGYLAIALKNHSNMIVLTILSVVILLNYNFFKEDLWFNFSDKEMQSGEVWVEQTRASIGDYWPKYGPIKTGFVVIPENVNLVSKTSNSFVFSVKGDASTVELPVNYFPGWNGKPSDSGQIEINVPNGNGEVKLHFENTPIRNVGNIFSILGVFVLWFLYFKPNKRLL